MTILPIIFDNPIFLREFRRRMRGRSMAVFLTVYVGLLCGVSFLILSVQSAALDPGQSQNFLSQISSIGRSAFVSVVSIQALLVLMAAPSITAGMITAERERQTFDFLRVTTLRPVAFVAGGLISTMLYVLLVLLCALPVLCVPFLYGGMSPEEVVGWFAILLGASLALCSVGLYLSSVRDKTRSAQGAMITITLVAFFGGFFAALRWAAIAGTASLTAPLWTPLPLFGGALVVSGWIVVAGGGVFLSGLMIVMACRKLYEPEARSLSYTQFLIAAALVMGGLMAKDWGGVAPDTAIVWLWTGGALLFAAAMIFCAARMRTGDDLWRLKRVLVPLRWIDESLFYMMLLSALWVAASWQYVYSGGAKIDEAAFGLGLAAIIAAMMLLATMARILSITVANRRAMTKGLMAAAIVLWLAAPAVLSRAAGMGNASHPALVAAARISPFFAVAEWMEASGGAAAGGAGPSAAGGGPSAAGSASARNWRAFPGSGVTLAYAVAALTGFLVSLPLYARRARSYPWE